MSNNIIITPGSASIQFSGSANNDTIRLQVEASGSVAFYGNSGSLFSITDQLSGSLMSVNDISGLPILEVFSDDRVVMGKVNQNTLVVTGSRVGIGVASPSTPLQVQGIVSASGFTGSLFGTASVATSASFAPTVLPSGVVSSSTQVSYTQLQNIPSGIVSSSIQINTGSFSGSFTGSLLGTSSWASNAISASLAQTASYFSGSITFPNGLIVTGGLQVTSVSASSGIIGNLTGTSSWASNAISSSIATTSSFALSSRVFPFTGSAVITGSLIVTASSTYGLEILNSATTMVLGGTGTGYVGTITSHPVNIVVANSNTWQFNTLSGFQPISNAVQDIGLTGTRVRTLWTTNVSSSNPIASASFATTASAASSITFTPSTASFAQTSSILISTGLTTLQQITEKLNPLTGATGTVTHDCSTGAIFYHSGIAANFTANLTNIPTTDNRTIAVSLILNQGGTGYYPNALQIDSVSQTIRWIGNSTPTPSINAIDVVTFSLIRTGATWYVLGQLAAFA